MNKEIIINLNKICIIKDKDHLMKEDSRDHKHNHIIIKTIIEILTKDKIMKIIKKNSLNKKMNNLNLGHNLEIKIKKNKEKVDLDRNLDLNIIVIIIINKIIGIMMRRINKKKMRVKNVQNRGKNLNLIHIQKNVIKKKIEKILPHDHKTNPKRYQ